MIEMATAILGITAHVPEHIHGDGKLDIIAVVLALAALVGVGGAFLMSRRS